MSDSWTMKLLKITSYSKGSYELFRKMFYLNMHTVNFHCIDNVTGAVPEKNFIGSILYKSKTY